MQTDILYASQHDTIASIKDKIKNHETNRICLVLPTRLTLFDASQLNILRSYCASLGLELAIVTREFYSLKYAKQLNIQQFASIRRARKVSWYIYDRELEEESTQDQNSQKQRKNLEELRTKAQKSTRPRKLGTFTRTILVASVFLSLFTLALYLIPSATVFITPEKISQEMKVPLLDQEGQLIIGNFVVIKNTTITVNTKEMKPTTGEIEIPKSTATGVIKFTNISNSIVQIPEGTLLYAIIDEKQVLVETTTEATLLPEVGSAVQTNITASNPGRQGNLPANSITNIVGDLSFYVTAINPTAMRGGADQTTQAPSKDDFTELRNQTMKTLEALAIQKFYSNSPEGIEITNISLLSSTEEFTPDSKYAAQELYLETEAEFQIDYVADQDLVQAFNIALDAQNKPSYVAVPNSLEYEKITTDIETYYGVTRDTVHEFNAQALAKQLAGKTRAMAIQTINTNLGTNTNPEVIFKPNFLNHIPLFHLPFFDQRIYIEVR